MVVPVFSVLTTPGEIFIKLLNAITCNLYGDVSGANF